MIKIFLILFISVASWAGIGNILAIKGKAEVKRFSKFIRAVNGMSLVKGDQIVTHVKSRVQVMLKDDTVVTIGQNSSFGFEEFDFDGTKNSKLSMRASRGFFRSVTGKIGKLAPQRFKVKTTSATIGIRGTDFSANILPTSEVIQCYSGTIVVMFDGVTRVLEPGMELIVHTDSSSKKSSVKKKKSAQQSKKTIAKKSQGIASENLSDITLQLDPTNTDFRRQTIQPTQNLFDASKIKTDTSSRDTVYQIY